MESKLSKSDGAAVDIFAILRRLKKAKLAYEEARAEATRHGPAIIKQSRVAMGLSQEEFGKLVKRHPIHISKLENGGMPPGLHLLLSLLDMHAAKRSKL